MTHALRGTIAPGRGDLTGHRAQALSVLKDDTSLGLANTRAALTSERTELIRVTGGRVFLLPAEAVTFIREQAMQSG